MQFTVTADSDIGNVKDTNQDSILVKHARWAKGELMMAIVCDGLGGLAKGELASATVIRTFAEWFDKELAYELENPDLNIIGHKWSQMLKDLNIKILEYGRANGFALGTTFTGMLCIEDSYVIVHVGDTRVYHLSSGIRQLTSDHTFIAREIRSGTMTVKQAMTDNRRNMLLQCVGASELLEPDVMVGRLEKGAYMLCSDGFRHEISVREIYKFLNPNNLIDKKVMKSKIRYLIELVKQRNEKDNISVILVKAE
jgi:serine/threonine protein phosphatase PrpC